MGFKHYLFEYGVILNGSKTLLTQSRTTEWFEYGVILNGSKTMKMTPKIVKTFEYGVILNGSKTSDDDDPRDV